MNRVQKIILGINITSFVVSLIALTISINMVTGFVSNRFIHLEKGQKAYMMNSKSGEIKLISKNGYTFVPFGSEVWHCAVMFNIN